MTKQEEIPYSEKSYELQWLEAQRDLAILEWETCNWLDRPLGEVKDD